MPSTSKAQHGFFGLVQAVKEGRTKMEDVRPGMRAKVQRATSSMTLDQIKDYTRTRTASLPQRMTADGRDRHARSA